MTARPDPERLAVWRSFTDAHAAITADLEQVLMADRDLPLAWYEVLVELHEAGGSMRMQSLAGRLVLHKSSLTRLIDRLEAADLVARVRCEDDNRGLNAELTKEGRDVLRRALPTYQRSVQRNFAQHLTDSDVVALQRALSKLMAANGRA